MTRRTKTLLRAGLVLLPLLAAAACNTVQGAGQDIKNTGAWIEKKAVPNK